MNSTSRNAGVQLPGTVGRAVAVFLGSGLRISLWLRWFIVIVWLAQLHRHVDFAQQAYFAHILFGALLLTVNTLVLYQVENRRGVSWRWAMALSAMDVAMLAGGLAIGFGFEGASFVLYYAALALFAVVCTSFRVTLVAATVIAAVYATLDLAAEPLDTLSVREGLVLLLGIFAMYAVVAAVSLVAGFERSRSWFDRVRRRKAVVREEELQQERIELSQTIHNTIAQSAYLIGLGLETAIELADGRNGETGDELTAKLEATLALSRSTMWELRHPIDIGAIFEGRELSRVLRSHASAFSTITSIPTEMLQSGQEPHLPTLTRRLLFSIAHNAMTNALRHSGAERITIELEFVDDAIRLSVSDDGIGLPEDFEDRGYGFGNMRADAERMGGWLETGVNESSQGTRVACVIPFDPKQRGGT